MEKQKIMIVDDTDINREILSEMLKNSYEIIEAENGMQAISILEEHDYDISLLLLDIVMPELDGFDVLKYMNRNNCIDSIPVIMISSETDSNFIKKAYDMGVVDYIGRPFDMDIVQRRVKNTIALYAKQRKLSDIVADKIQEKTGQSELMISLLSQIVEFRNGESGQHVLHINIITALLLRRLMEKTGRYGLKSEDVSLICSASSLHDIGKIAIPSEILNKPGRLTDEEYEIIKTHSGVGASMLESLSKYNDEPLLKWAYEICRWHHERYDGNGYPDGLKGDEIPISAQVVSLADVYDALTSERCYKNAIPHEDAIDMIINGRCGVFNPLLIECLTDISDVIQKELKTDGIDVKRQIEAFDIAEEINRHSELSASSQLINQLEFEQGKATFLEGEIHQIVFTYKEDPLYFKINKEGAELLGIKEVIVDPIHDAEFVDRFGINMSSFSDRGKDMSAEDPIFAVDSKVKIGNEFRPCCYRCQSIWSNSGERKYLGVVGEILFS